MNYLQTLLGRCGELLFPDPPSIARWRSLTSTILARTATSHFVTREVQCLSPLPFSHAMVRSAIHAAKYHNHHRAATLLGETLAPFVAEELADHRMLGKYHTALLVPIPLHHARMRERGFNQSERIAQALLHELTEPSVTLCTALARKVNTSHQTRQHDRAERLRNMHGAFEVPDGTRVCGRDIILLDDVITTGATLYEAKNTLLEAGAREVLCVAVAH